MKFLKLSILLLFTLLLSTQITPAAKNYAEGELLVKFRNGTVSGESRSANAAIGAEAIETFIDLKWQRVKLPEGLSIVDAALYYGKLEGVEYVQPNYYYHMLATPNDPSYTATGMYGLGKISAPQAWDLTTGSSGIVVADIDSGLRLTHQDIVPNLWVNTGEIAGNNVDDDGNGFIDDVNGFDFFYNDPDPSDQNGHGTHTAGTIGARGNNGLNVVGVNWDVKIMPIKIYSPNGTDTTSAMLINAYNYVRMMKNRGVNIRVTNNSYGGCGEACGFDQATKDAIDAIGDSNILQVFAAGNAGTNNDNAPFYPASYTSPSILAVASTTSTDARSSFSCYGATSVDLAAPGSSILSTYSSSNTSTSTLSGTSMATPHVAGAAALLAAHNPNLSAASLKATLMNTVDPLTTFNSTPIKTQGRLNVFKALTQQTVCIFSLSTNGVNTGSSASTGSVAVTTSTNCDYPVKSNAPWITVTAGNPGSGNGTVSYSVQANTGAARSGTISIAEKTYNIFQAGALTTPTNDVLDFDGDGKTDHVAIQNVGGGMVWHINRTTAGYTATSFGLFAGDIPVPMDFDGDGKTDIAVWRADPQGYFYVIRSSDGAVAINAWGSAGDDPRMTQDFDGDGKADMTVVRNQGGTLVWYVLKSTGGVLGHYFGTATDLPLRGDFDGDGKADAAVYRPASGTPANSFIALKSSDGGLIASNFGTSATDKIVPGDFNGDGKTDLAVWRATDGNWHILSSAGNAYSVVPFGSGATDIPAPGDYDGDGKTDFGVWSTGPNPGDAGTFKILTQLSVSSQFGWGSNGFKIPVNSLQVRN